MQRGPQSTRLPYLIESVRKHGDSDECLIWPFGHNHQGYGRLWVKCKKEMVHRVAYKLFVGELERGMCALHRCDNMPCFNPKHLFKGTHADNVRDMVKKGRNRDRHGHLVTRGTLDLFPPP
jgi:hypothetical protein